MDQVADGANSLWNSARYRVVHLLKNPTKPHDSIPDLIDECVSENRLGRTFFYRIALRSFAMLNGLPSWTEMENASPHDLGLALRQSAVVNLSNLKDDCSAEASPGQTREWARINVGRWYTAIKELRPDLVICGGTFFAVAEVIPNQGYTCTTGMHYMRTNDTPETIFLDVCHPSARYPLSMVHTHFVASCRELALGA